MTVDDLAEYGMVRMSDSDIRGFLSSQSVGVLGLPGGDTSAPVLRPLSYWFDGDSAIYFVYVLGSSSEKQRYSQQAETAQFTVYRAETPFNWRSVIVSGPLSEVPHDERPAVLEAMDIRWRPDLFERASAGTDTTLYRLDIVAQDGLKHLGLPPGLDDQSADADEY